MHRRGLVHRDLKPTNVMLDDYGRARIIDLGLACIVNAQSRTASARGTFLYFSPEKAAGDQYDGKDDVWALACIVGGLLTQVLVDRFCSVHS